MPRTESVIRVFVASPGDVQPERDAVDEVVEELNATWASRPYRLEVIRWERNARPGVGSDAQGVINEQIQDDYDIFLGVLWSRCGTRTPRAESGTIEDFRIAHARYVAEPNSLRLMMYFKDEPVPVAPSRLDLEDLAKIRAFESELKDIGVLYWRFSSLDEFKKYLRIHLSKEVPSFEGSYMDKPPQPLTRNTRNNAEDVASAGAATSEAEEEGLLDLLELAGDSLAAATRAGERMSSATDELGSRMTSATEEMNSRGKPSDLIELKEMKQRVNRTAADLNRFADQVESELPLFRSGFSNSMDAYSKAATLFGDFRAADESQNTDLRSSLEAIGSLRETLARVRTVASDFANIIRGLPRVTTKFNRARKRSVDALERLDYEYESAVNLAAETERIWSELMGENI